MWEEDDDENGDEIERLETGIDRFFSRALYEMENALFDIESKALKPLFRIELSDEWVTVAFDLPGVRKEDIEVTCTEDTVSMEAEMTKPVTLRVPGNKNVPAEFERYTKKIRLPVKVDPNNGTAKYRNGMIVVKLPIARSGKAVKILHR